MRILVTGSEGFLGAHLVRELKRHDHEVVGYDLARGQDILDRKQLDAALHGVHVCIHLAAIADLYIAEEHPEQAQRVNVQGTATVLEACDLAGVRLLYCSTCCIYGNNGVACSDETAPAMPTELYARTKLEGEHLIQGSRHSHVILRLATFYGPGMRQSLATWRFLHAALEGETITIHGSGEQTRCYTHVEDVCTGIIRVLEEPTASGIINISDDRSVSVNELAEISMKIVGHRVPTKKVKDRDGQIHHSAIDNTRLRRLGWAPRWTLEEGLWECVSELQKTNNHD